MPKKNLALRQQIAELHMGGMKQAAIAKEVGKTRARVGQLLEELGIKERDPWMPSEAPVRAALQESTSSSDFAQCLNLPESQAMIAVRHYQLTNELKLAKAQWRANKYANHRIPLIRDIKSLAIELGHTPTAFELRMGGLHLETLKRYFDSVEDAILAAGLIPTVIGAKPADLPEGFEVDAFSKAAIERYIAKKKEGQTFESQRPIIQKIRDLALSLGHTPRQKDLFASGIAFSTIKQVFGTVRAAILASDLIPNENKRHPSPLPNGFIDITQPDIDRAKVRKRASQLRRLHPDLPPPEGNLHPKLITQNGSGGYQRDPNVVAWVLQEAKGYCELCGEEGYEDDYGERFLETHHIVLLSKGGPDIITNVVGVCETCHGKLHRAKNREQLKGELYRKVVRLRRVDGAHLL